MQILLLIGYVGVINLLKSCALPFAVGYFIFFLSIGLWVVANNPKPKFWKTFRYGMLFALGFILIFVAKAATLTAIGASLSGQGELYVRLGGLILMFLGLVMMPVVNLAEKLKLGKWAGWASIAAGGTFALSWQPCSVKVIPAFQQLLSNDGTIVAGIIFLTMIGLGIVVPLLILSVVPSIIFKFIRLSQKTARGGETLGAALLFALGFMFLTGTISIFYSLVGMIR